MSPINSSTSSSSFSILIIRLSSFGDVILGTSVLTQEQLKKKYIMQSGENFSIDWLVSKEYRDLLVDHPQLRTVHGFDRKSGILGLLKLSKLLAAMDYDGVIDLHQTTRTYLLRFFYFFSRIYIKNRNSGNMRSSNYLWETVKKPRWRLSGLFVFKGLWPRRFYPPSVLSRIATFLNVDRVVTDLSHFKNSAIRAQLLPSIPRYYVVMPSSVWEGKCWETENYVEVIRQLANRIPSIPVIVGTEKDRLSKKLVQRLKERQIDHFNGVGKWTQKELAAAVGESLFYLGSDTGISHLAEALRVPAVVLFGPTSPEIGFGPWLTHSVSVEAPVKCRPCGKDGSHCYRVFNPYLCMREITPAKVVNEVIKLAANIGIEKCK